MWRAAQTPLKSYDSRTVDPFGTILGLSQIKAKTLKDYVSL